jgi:hypothetical protein
LIITLDPQTDFYADYKNPGTKTEITKLQAHLDQSYSYMIFADADTPELPILEEYLEEWGISFVCYEGDGTYELCDPEFSLANGLTGGIYKNLTAEQGGDVDYLAIDAEVGEMLHGAAPEIDDEELAYVLSEGEAFSDGFDAALSEIVSK